MSERIQSIEHHKEVMIAAVANLAMRLHMLVGDEATPITMHLKPDGSKVTSADIELNELFNNYIRARCPEDYIQGEELSAGPEGEFDPERHGLWTVDPIDGTNGFWRDYGNRHFKASNTTIQTSWFAPGESAPTLSLIASPLNELKTTLLATPEGTFYATEHTLPWKQVYAPHGPETLEDVARYDKNFWPGIDTRYEQIGEFFPYARRINHPLGYAALALGDCDLGMFPGTHPHDIAPNAHIVHQAGGVVRTLAGESYDDVDWRVEPTAGVLVTGNEALADAFLCKLLAE
jgi:3'-phosphoadenosine 5'-phosphosulfate (PAPS) 3'-phosphatase